jgi:hypothetical protein
VKNKLLEDFRREIATDNVFEPITVSHRESDSKNVDSSSEDEDLAGMQ